MNRLIGIGEKFPEFSMQACVSLEHGKEFVTVHRRDMEGKWTVLFFWPLDFTFVCPTELAEFNHRLKDFRDRDAQVLGISNDSHFVHLAWRNAHPDLKDLGYPMLADNKKDLSEALGVLHPTEKVPLRATFIVDPEGVIRWVSVNDLNVGRNINEVLRILDALQTGELCPCNWEKGRPTLKV
ncbi:MAG: alkyl hydroperoxide reductase [Candidatus Lindowbacteria bacterium RIFCSPLOWO2_12_FULL_62_27]|nr:MAG: alkyl hydroperoxide reductase [Candidatus Lindowbacteria bacterium RIFCSPLOWO2_12_FULL_62_27]OGH58796.1 MAG: alkyl hydroperoxide reductase [Candidatus Lindowbacteria bacterium RIFCSPLOWO2_02_FULL_62_12]